MWRLVPRALSTNVSNSIYFTNLDHRLVPIPSLVTNKPSPVPRLWLQIHHLSFWITHFKNPHKFAKARALTWNSMLHSVVIHVPAGSHANYWNKINCLHKKRINSYRIGLVHQHGRRFIVLEHQYGWDDVISIPSLQNNQSINQSNFI